MRRPDCACTSRFPWTYRWSRRNRSRGPMVPVSKRACILLTEDEPLLAVELKMFLNDSGYDVAGSLCLRRPDLEGVAESADCRRGARHKPSRSYVFPLVDRLSEAGIPFLFLTGHSHSLVPERYRDRPFLNKPFERDTLLSVIRQLVPRPPPRGEGGDGKPGAKDRRARPDQGWPAHR